MTELNRSSTLSLRRNGSPALTGPRPKPAVTQPKPRKSAEPVVATAGDDRKLDSAALLQGRSHVSIMHNGQTYQLRATRLGKLILTK
ncbi:hemin uptake protein HemP [Paraburkholderia sp. CNPSo 3274]|uniref:hemin uptake protein HemP n=1 Tax=Paraburkholderia sp. CNPSo 3274 TaxID=2940932 RepID=UPI0020B885A1|nr:hemin uptake protein HemP [Paraburkholderia sp. CNPSo 3274]MCP3706603.1 hemin uptake protein HemP [Paraburkholderia sp. CNPSo 3274]